MDWQKQILFNCIPSKQGGTTGNKPLVPENFLPEIFRDERFFVLGPKATFLPFKTTRIIEQ
jgi:hypothetical protein